MTSTMDLVTDSVADLTEKASKEEKSRSFGQMNTKERLKYMKEVITVEPLIAAYIMASVLCGPALANLEFEKACKSDLDYNDTVCDAVLTGEHTNYTTQNDNIQVLISDMHSWQQPLQSVMPLILVLFLGSYSDRHKWRKPFLLLPIFGELFAVAGCILCVIFMKEWPLAAQGIWQTVVPSFFGGQTMIVMAVYAYIADVSTLEMRTLRVGIVQIVLNTCYPAVQAFSGILFAKIGYIGVLSIALCFYIFGLCYGFFWIKEPKTPIKSNKKSLLMDIFDPRHAIETFSILLKKRPGTNRLYILIVLLNLFIFTGVVTGEASIFFLYAQSVLQWTVVEFSYFGTVNTLVHLFGTAIAVPLFTKVFRLTDVVIVILTFLDKIITNFVFALAKTNTMVYAAAFVSVITGVTPVAIRSMATKTVSEDDLGKAQSLFGICEAIANAVFAIIYNKGIYVNTLETLPTAFFYLGIITYGACCIILCFVYIAERRIKKVTPKGELNGTNCTTEKPVPMEDIQITHI